MITALRNVTPLPMMNTVEPPNNGHVGDNINSAVLSFIEKLSSFRGSKSTGHVICGTSNSVLCREVSLFRRVHYRRFHCNSEKVDLAHSVCSRPDGSCQKPTCMCGHILLYSTKPHIN